MKREEPSPSVKPKPNSNLKFNPKVSVRNIERKTSKILIPFKNLRKKKVKPASRLQMIGKLGQISIPLSEQNTIKLWSEYDEMNTEIESFNGTEPWCLVPKEKGQKIIPSRWVYKIKHDSKGNIDKIKACCVAKGFQKTK